MHDRPLSPHLSIYKFKYTLVTSISNRLSGLVLSVGLLALAYWILALAAGAEAYARAMQVLTHPLAKLLFAAIGVAFAYHLLAGIRHLVWDTGRGLERAQAQRSSWMLLIGTIVLVAVFAWLWLRGGAAAT